MEDSEFVGVLIESFDALVSESVVGDVELVEVEIAAVEHLFEAVISDVVIDDVEGFEPLREVLGNVEETLVGYFAAVEFKLFEVGVAFQELIKQALIKFGEVVLEYLYAGAG